ncbi:hypothetical protein R3Q06_10665 [Rhodococcus erythropolis]|uniref:hypothetical protein n=1 Tax=Rhodococcus erythropolis TaxID=1833 RepID=UPI00294A4DFF|nr:hypothetical protein [Rhodococcus erythropolis]MDV6273960.1 hypothetical protein [Rhodococcus erythropolis]
MSHPHSRDLDSLLENVPPTDRARALVDHHTSLTDQFVAEFEAGIIDQGLTRNHLGT